MCADNLASRRDEMRQRTASGEQDDDRQGKQIILLVFSAQSMRARGGNVRVIPI